MALSTPSPDSETCFLYLVRHGATANNVAKPPRIQGSKSDLELSSAGKRQAKQTADYLADVPFAGVYSSPLHRARQTAEEIASQHDLAVETIEALSECDVGRWEGRSWPQIQETDREAYDRFMTEPEVHGYAGGENMTQLMARVAPAFAQIMQENVGRIVVAVAHNVVNRSYIGRLLDLHAANARNIPQHNCGINVIRWRDGVAKPLTINMLLHLNPW